MVKVDFSNPYLRKCLPVYIKEHKERLTDIAAKLPEFAARMRDAESLEADGQGRKPRPLAVVLDIDEVILANIHMNSFSAPAGVQGPTAIDFHAADYFMAPNGQRWPRNDCRLNPLMDGARDLLSTIRQLGLVVYFITGRLESIRAETVENFEYVGLAGTFLPASAFENGAAMDAYDARLCKTFFESEDLAAPDGMLIMCPNDWFPNDGKSIREFKEARRAIIDKTHRIILNVGDQASDLGLYGDKQVHLPHPFYYTY
jgi:predicted secreted acid phosphatase